MRATGRLERAVAMLMVPCAFALVGCATGALDGTAPEAGSSPAATVAPEASEASAPAAPVAILDEPDIEALYELLAEEDAESLIAQAYVEPDAAWIAAHPADYGIYGPVPQKKLLTLTARDPEAAAYVRGFQEAYPADGPAYDAPALPEGSPSPDVPETAVPHLYQWDLRWGYIPYGGFCMGTSACGPTALTMVYRALTGDGSITPFDMAQRAYEWGFVSESGTGSEILSAPCEELGLICWEVPATAEDIVAMLRDGHPLIANVRVGYFTDSGHFFVLAGVTDEGLIILNDPYSVTRSSQLWDPELIATESMAVYAYNVADDAEGK